MTSMQWILFFHGGNSLFLSFLPFSQFVLTPLMKVKLFHFSENFVTMETPHAIPICLSSNDLLTGTCDTCYVVCSLTQTNKRNYDDEQILEACSAQ